MKTPSNNKRRIIRNFLFFVGIMLLFSSSIAYKMFKTTVVYAASWNAKADSILTKESILEPERGKLLADNGTVLAANMVFYTARIDWNARGLVQDTVDLYLPALADSMAAFEPSRTSKQWKDELYKAYVKTNSHGKKNSSYRLIKRLLTSSEFERLTTFPLFNKGRAKTGLYSETSVRRSKPFGSMASRSIGNVGESESRTGLHGTSGLEMALDSLLYGIPGKTTKQQLTNNIVNAVKEPATPGYDVTTTINIDMQDIVETELYSMLKETEAAWGTAILMEVATGEIKAISNLEWNNSLNDYVEGRNNAVLGYEPGSVMKPISMLVAMEDGAVKSATQVFQTGHSWSCYTGAKALTDHYGAPQLSAEQIIARSSNIGISRIIYGIYGKNPDGFRQRLEQLGFFEPFNSGIGGEQQPVFQKLGHTNADRVALTRMAFGYTTLIPPLSTLAIYNAIANDGKYVRPHLFKKLSREGEQDSIIPTSYIRDQICSPHNAQELRKMLHEVVWSEYGTAHRYLQDDKVEIAGKTGTAFITEGGHYSAKKRYAFCGFFPYSAPKYSCIVLKLGGAGSAASSSGMVLKNIALRLYARGLLGNESTYQVETDAKGNVVKHDNSAPVLYTQDSNARLASQLNVKAHKNARPGDQPKEGVPNVKNMSVRDAIIRLEKLGLNVQFKGSGIVAGQSLPPGSSYKRGQTILLTLAH